ncbi:MAG: replicative DNA helicase, partial [Actinomycetales bacterium]
MRSCLPVSVSDLYPEAPEEERGAPTRVPPQDIAAEQSVLGAMLMSKQAIDPASDVLQGRDFYRPAHE